MPYREGLAREESCLTTKSLWVSPIGTALVSEAGWYVRRAYFCITHLLAQGPSRTCIESHKHEEKKKRVGPPCRFCSKLIDRLIELFREDLRTAHASATLQQGHSFHLPTLEIQKTHHPGPLYFQSCGTRTGVQGYLIQNKRFT